ncbi:probable GPI-anchored adhesin-like protein PGA55 [Haliotis rubra]|uniref:probable GPI-anchored adhesin-like protein PGA55 n=1 Tax=Haliotis rubra TaxID=36100 RepID=UPI001EE4EBE7|nr:probable GPI-anchored adhesin-like protein PGA55 [Haliotis rubra]
MSWSRTEPNKPETEKCIRLHFTSNKFRTTECSTNRHVVCQESTDECTFERFDGQDVVILTSASSINVSIDDCKRACLTHTGSAQCVSIVYDSETTSGDPCRIYTRLKVYIKDNPEMTSSSGRTVLVKRCVQGDYMSTAVSVPTNTDNDPITACLVTTSLTSIKISSSPTYPGTTMDIQLSVLTDTQSQMIHSSYVSFSNGGSVYESAFTSANIFPETNSMTSSSVNSPETSVIETEPSSESHSTSTSRMYSVAISMISSSVKASVIETESIESHLTSTMTSNKLTPISLYSSTSSGGFRDSTSHNLYWSNAYLTSFSDSTTIKTASASNVAPSETLTMTMSESSQITTLPDVIDTASSEDTRPTSTIVSDPLETESSTQVSNLDLDPSSVVSSTVSPGSRTPSEHHCVCGCMHPLMSMVFDVNGYLLDRKNLSSYRRSKTSANDDRVSARAIGGSGLAIILLVTALIVCVDVDRMIRATGHCRKRQALSMFSSICCKRGDKL